MKNDYTHAGESKMTIVYFNIIHVVQQVKSIAIMDPLGAQVQLCIYCMLS